MNINWIQLCRQADPIIIPPCSTLVYPNNVLTLEGERAWGCIRIALTGGGTILLHLPLELVIPILSALSEPTGCGRIIEWDFAGDISNLRGIVNALT